MSFSRFVIILGEFCIGMVCFHIAELWVSLKFWLMNCEKMIVMYVYYLVINLELNYLHRF